MLTHALTSYHENCLSGRRLPRRSLDVFGMRAKLTGYLGGSHWRARWTSNRVAFDSSLHPATSTKGLYLKSIWKLIINKI